ncbi:MAG: DUF4900 domain-containing protein [bacterium]|nr:DUF4900 domain-containing protein [bacterium]
MFRRVLRNQRGYSLIFAVPMAALLLASTLAYLKWQVSAQYNARHQVASIQAYYTAQAAVIAVPLAYMRNQPPGFSTTTSIPFADGYIDGVGRYLRPLIQYTSFQGMQAGNLIQNKDYLLSATGIATVNDARGFRTKNVEVRRKALLRIRKKSFQQYFYFTDIEQTRFGEFIWFFGGDTLYAPVHSNTDIGVHSGAVFYGFVTTVGRILTPNGSSFYALPAPGYRERVRRIDIPVRADLLREAASAGGTWLDTRNNEETYGLRFRGSAADVWIWRTGTTSPFMVEPPENTITIPSNREYGIFCDGDLWIQGSVTGNVGIGAQGNLRLMDNIVYTDCATWPYLVLPNSPNSMTLVSEAPEPVARTDPWTGILIANTWANGREDAANHFGVGTGSQHRRDIAIHGQLFALNSSFTFQEHNDNEGYDPYVYSCPQHGQDERGYIYLRGAVTQHRRGYVHRGNTETTGIRSGYLKSYRWDPRWDTRSGNVYAAPPFQVDLTSQGFQKWEILGWEDVAKSNE